jgi:hypothetical protein
VKVEKTYEYIPKLIKNILEARTANTIPIRTPISLEPADPRNIAPRIASLQKPPLEELKEKQVSRF